MQQNEKKKPMFCLRLDAELKEKVVQYRFKRQIDSVSEAFHRLLEIALKEENAS